jgi:hypothetical protein
LKNARVLLRARAAHLLCRNGLHGEIELQFRHVGGRQQLLRGVERRPQLVECVGGGEAEREELRRTLRIGRRRCGQFDDAVQRRRHAARRTRGAAAQWRRQQAPQLGFAFAATAKVKQRHATHEQLQITHRWRASCSNGYFLSLAFCED